MNTLLKKIEAFLKVVTGVDGKVNELNNRVNEMNGRVDSHANSIGNLESHFAALQEALNQSQTPVPEKVEEVIDTTNIDQMLASLGYVE